MRVISAKILVQLWCGQPCRQNLLIYVVSTFRFSSALTVQNILTTCIVSMEISVAVTNFHFIILFLRMVWGIFSASLIVMKTRMDKGIQLTLIDQKPLVKSQIKDRIRSSPTLRESNNKLISRSLQDSILLLSNILELLQFPDMIN